MIVKKIETFLLSDKLEESFYFSQFEYSTRLICIVKITTEDGTVGWGEGYGFASIIKAGVEFLTPLVVGRSALDTDRIWADMFRKCTDHARKGILLSSISAIDIALWDLKGKILKQPVSTLLGGRFRERVKCYATGLYFTASMEGCMEQKLAEEALMYKDQGFKALKMKVGLSIEQDIKNVTAVRNAIGDDMALGIDSNHAYNLREALKLCRALEPLNIMWFEEPLSPDNYDGFKALRSKTSIPIATGECEYLMNGFNNLLSNGCVDFIQPETSATGGFTEIKRIAALASMYNVELTPHNWGTGIVIAANLHLCSNLNYTPGRMFAGEPLLEFDRSPNRLREELITKPFAAKDGYLDVPTGYGLGVEVNEDKLYEFTLKI